MNNRFLANFPWINLLAVFWILIFFIIDFFHSINVSHTTPQSLMLFLEVFMTIATDIKIILIILDCFPSTKALLKFLPACNIQLWQMLKNTMFKPYVRMRPLICVDVSELDDHVQNLEKSLKAAVLYFDI